VILGHLVRQEIVRSLQQTQGLGSMLQQFHRLYDETIRRRGAFTFTDAQYLLTPRNPMGAGSISRQAGEADRLYIDYRLDARLDHWLLDEFQDTSDLQWETLDNLASEIIQDTGGDRSFFLVGDVKQAIHGWRGGNSRLFGELLKRYKDGIHLETLSESFRSTKPVLAFVNRLFSDLEGLDMPPAAVASWAELWKPHVSRIDKPGCAAWIEPVVENGDEMDDAVYRAAAGLIRELNPVARSLSVALLLPTNADCTKAADALRRELAEDRIPIVNEGAAGLADNPVVALMRSLLKTAGHPGDTLAVLHLRMSPLGSVVDEAGARLPLLLQAQIQNEGFAALIRTWARHLEAASGPLDRFGAKRLQDLLSLASAADADGIRDPDELIAQIENKELREQTAGGAVRIMTVHQSKGLGFDAVFVPLLKNDDLRQPGQLDLVSGLTGEQPWILKMPRKVVCQADRVLKERLEQATAESAFANLCVLYVAMTRARQGLYAITGYGRKDRKSERSLSAGILMSQRLLGTDQPESAEGARRMAGGVPLRVLAEEGEWAWAESIPLTGPAPEQAAAGGATFPSSPGLQPRLLRLEPSRGGGEDRQADWLFKPESRGVLEFGTLIHGYLSRVEWSEDADVEAILSSWKPETAVPEDVRADAATQFRRLMSAPDVRQVLARPAAPASLWREMRFELVDGNTWVSGAFDRVTVFRDAGGRPRRAEVMDFKSTRVQREADLAPAAALHRRQLLTYRRALSLILKLDEAAVTMRILFTRMGKVFSLPAH
jgi:ATP-dependent exoDNAse (exonuclease V) beta subunit